MVTTIHQEESVESYPDAPAGLSDEAQALDAAMIWSRLEQWIAHRWSERTAVWIAEGVGEWIPPLRPATITETEIWDGESWGPVAQIAAPRGLTLLSRGPYRITATVGEGPVPEGAQEAYRRLAEYLAASDEGAPGASSYAVNIGQLSETIRRNPAHIAKAIHNSGAADLLRPYRRA